MGRALDLVGQTFGRLTVKRPIGRDNNGNIVWSCDCTCGKNTDVRATCLVNGYTESCGCLNDEARIKHNCVCCGYPILERDHQLALCTTCYALHTKHQDMHSRCYRSNHPAAKYYHDKGIEVHPDWHRDNPDGFKNFYNWAITAGYKHDPSKSPQAIHRKDSELDYTENNCELLAHDKHAIIHRAERQEKKQMRAMIEEQVAAAFRCK